MAESPVIGSAGDAPAPSGDRAPGGGGGGSDPIVREILAVQSVLLPRSLVDAQVVVKEAQ